MNRSGVLALGVWAAAAPLLFAADELPPMFPFVLSYDAPDNASSMAHLLDAPAGRHGFVRDGRNDPPQAAQ